LAGRIQIDIAANIEAVKTAMTEAAKDAGRAAGGAQLVAVSKTQPVDRIELALAAGQRIFGENRVQEAEGKWPALKARHGDIELHLIGSLQSNKTRAALDLFDVIQTLDRPKLARAIRREIDNGASAPQLFVQVNTGEEPQKGGVLPADLPALLDLCRDELALHVVGLMCIPPAGEEAALHFALLAKLARRHGLSGLSMGMSADYELASAMGASHVRVGTTIFGARVTADKS
jgi:hypothetical protein